MRDMFSGRFDQAEALVVPRDRQLIKAVALGLSPVSVRESNLTAGKTVITGKTAIVVVKGIVCTTASRQRFIGPLTAPRRGQCIRNDDPASNDPFFRVGVRVGLGPGWLVDPTLR